MVDEIETDYLVVGAGASGMAFVDALIAADPSADVVLVDRQHRPGGHWLNAYPFVRLHQPSAYYGVASTPLGADRIDRGGGNDGFYERATASEICGYFARVLDDVFLPSGRVRFFGMTDCATAGEPEGPHMLSAVLSGETTEVRVRRRVVDATYVQSEIPSRRPPAYAVGEGVTVIPPNDIVALDEAPPRFTVIGGGKTGMDTCNWLLDTGVPVERIRWIRSRDPWLFDRAWMQPLEQVASFMRTQAAWVEACATADSAEDFAHRLEAAGAMTRLDPDIEPEAFRGATISQAELAALRTIRDVVRLGRVVGIDSDRVELTGGDVDVLAGEVFVDCTAPGVQSRDVAPVYAPGRITIQYVTLGVVPWSAALIGYIETIDVDDDERNRLCPAAPFTGDAADLLVLAQALMSGLTARASHPVVSVWDNACRLNPTRGADDRLTEPEVLAAFTSLGEHLGAAFDNLARLTSAAS